MNGVVKKRGDMAANVINPTHSPWVPSSSGMLNTHAPRATIRAHAPLLLHSVANAMNRKSRNTSAARNRWALCAKKFRCGASFVAMWRLLPRPKPVCNGGCGCRAHLRGVRAVSVVICGLPGGYARIVPQPSIP